MLSLSSNWVSGEIKFADLIFFFNFGSFVWSRLKSSTHQLPGKWYPIIDPNHLISIPSPRLNCLKPYPLQQHIAILPYIRQYPHTPQYKLLLICSYSLMQMVLTYVMSILTVEHCTINGQLYLQNFKWKKFISSCNGLASVIKLFYL